MLYEFALNASVVLQPVIITCGLCLPVRSGAQPGTYRVAETYDEHAAAGILPISARQIMADAEDELMRGGPKSQSGLLMACRLASRVHQWQPAKPRCQ